MLPWPVYFLLVTYLCRDTRPFCVPPLFVSQVCPSFQYAIMVTVRHYFCISYTVWIKAIQRFRIWPITVGFKFCGMQ